jgi:archaellum component FlaC
VTNEELLTVLERRFDAIDARFEQIDARFEQIDVRFDRLETDLRHANVQIEGLWSVTKQLGENYALLDEKLERFRSETYERFEAVDRRFDVIEDLIRPS